MKRIYFGDKTIEVGFIKFGFLGGSTGINKSQVIACIPTFEVDPDDVSLDEADVFGYTLRGVVGEHIAGPVKRGSAGVEIDIEILSIPAIVQFVKGIESLEGFDSKWKFDPPINRE